MASNKEIVWPPQTTEDVLNLTPRKSRTTGQNAPCSPSPLRRAALPSPFGGNGSQDDDEDTDDDEETLKLKLAQIEAKLKLKQFQRKQKSSQALGQQLARNHDRRDHTTTTAAGDAKAQVQVPLSPVAPRPEPAAPKSPSRVLLGIDKGLKGRDVSLRRAPSLRNGGPASPQRPKKTFSERIAEERVKEKSKLERQRLLEKSRSTSFVDFSQDAPPIFGAAMVTTTSASPSSSSNFLGSRLEPHLQPSRKLADPFVSESSTSPPAEDATDEGGFDSYSGLHLSKRTISHVNVSRHLSPKTVYLLPHLLKSVVSPDFDPPDVEGDWVAMGVICSKSNPRDVGQNTNAKGTGKKYMVLQLTDLKWEVELFLFGSAFDKFWKVPVGTVVAILNPGIMKPRNADTGKFSLTLTDSSDTLLEIGHSRDLDFCKTVKRDGKRCSSWVDKRHTHYCAFHVEQGVNKSRVARAEVNSMSKLFSPPRRPGTARPRKFLGGRKGGAAVRDDGLLPDDASGAIIDLPQRAGGAGGKVFVAPGRSTASLLDDQSYLADSFHRGSKEDRLQRRLADSQKEREITRRLIMAQGREGGIGVDYLKKGVGWNEEQLKKHGNINREYSNMSTSSALSSLRQRSKEASTVSLSPIKRKRLEPPLSPKKKTRFALALEPVPEEDSNDYNDDDDDLWIV